MSPPAASSSANFPTPEGFFKSWTLDRILNEDLVTHTFWLLGTAALPGGDGQRFPAVLRLAQTPLTPVSATALGYKDAWTGIDMVTTNDIYATMLGRAAGAHGGGEFQISIICPATDKHIKKYSPQESKIIRETPEKYFAVVAPYIAALPLSSISWLYAILEGTAEAESVIYRDEDASSGFVLTPDLKWDQKTLSSLYLLVIPMIRSLKSIRDLTTAHLPLLKKIKVETERNAMERYGVPEGGLRMFVHYQPSYYHFHVHVTHISNSGFMGSTVGQAHLLSDLIDNLELEALSPVENAVPHYHRRTFEYALGKEHPLFKSLDY